MDQIDRNLEAAWGRVSAKVRADRVEAVKRLRRQRGEMVRRPIRAWCMVLRASDTRLSGMNCVVQPVSEEELAAWDLSGPAGPFESDHASVSAWALTGDPHITSVDQLVERQVAHRLVMSGSTIRELVKPVVVKWPGEDWKKVAAMCGVSKHYLRSWIKNGQVVVDHHRSARSLGQRGKPVPMVYTPSPIDPNSFDARPPHRIWGSLWQEMWQRLPVDFVQEAVRVPRWRLMKGQLVFRGWTWVCPGRVGPDGQYIGCGRTCNRLFGPLPPWTVPEALGDRLEVEAEAGSGLAGAWSPGFTDAVSGQRSFACKECWGVRDVSLVGPDGWNLFVSQISGGLLYGHEVERPMDEAPQRRKRRYSKRKAKPAVRREQVRRLLLDGLSYQEIADRMGVAYCTVHGHARRVFKQEGVGGRPEFLQRCGGEVG